MKTSAPQASSCWKRLFQKNKDTTSCKKIQSGKNEKQIASSLHNKSLFYLMFAFVIL